MSASPRTQDYLVHIADALARIRHYTAGLDEAGFLASTLVQDAVIRNIEIIGEACSKLGRHDADFVQQHADVPWRFAIGMRNVLAHGYFKVDLEAVWRTVQQDLPLFAGQIESLVRE